MSLLLYRTFKRQLGWWLNTVSIMRSFSADQHHRSRKSTEAQKLIAADAVTRGQTHRDDESTTILKSRRGRVRICQTEM